MTVELLKLSIHALNPSVRLRRHSNIFSSRTENLIPQPIFTFKLYLIITFQGNVTANCLCYVPKSYTSNAFTPIRIFGRRRSNLPSRNTVLANLRPSGLDGMPSFHNSR